MTGVFILFAIVSIVNIICLILLSWEDVINRSTLVSCAALSWFLLFIIFISCYGSYAGSPSAMDVYQGKTELKYTVQGGKITDSVVVYQNNQN